jgi:hypothetical protein
VKHFATPPGGKDAAIVSQKMWLVRELPGSLKGVLPDLRPIDAEMVSRAPCAFTPFSQQRFEKQFRWFFHDGKALFSLFQESRPWILISHRPA